VDYFRNYYRIPVSKLLPFGALLVPFSYFFYHHAERPTGDRQRYLEDFFWRASLGGRYSYAVESHLAADIRRIDSILKGVLPEYDYPIDTTAGFVERNGYFSTGRSYVKALLCVLAFQEPKSFVDGSTVRISNDWLKQANSRNYHHFFPRSYLKKQGFDDDYANHVANITIVDDFLNKREIRAKPPRVYMDSFAARNPALRETMRTHLIDVDEFGIWENDYDTFFKRRCEVLAAELQRRVIPQQVDQREQEPTADDADDEIAVI